jgi:branched-chain amino acid aminotransferase
LECFGAGTAVIVSGVSNIHYKGTNYPIPVERTLNIGKISHQIRKSLLDIQEGRAEDRYGWITRVK